MSGHGHDMVKESVDTLLAFERERGTVMHIDPEPLDPGMSLNAWAEVINQYAIHKGWWDTPESRNFGDLTSLLHSEVTEAYEEYRNGRTPTERYYTLDANGQHKPEGIPSELADLIIRVLDMVGHYGINIEAVLAEKHEYNLTREYRHGGKVS